MIQSHRSLKEFPSCIQSQLRIINDHNPIQHSFRSNSETRHVKFKQSRNICAAFYSAPYFSNLKNGFHYVSRELTVNHIQR